MLPVRHGEQVIITNREKPQAVITPVNENELEDIVFSSSPFLKMLDEVRKEGKEKGGISLQAARAKLLRRQ